MLGMTYVTIRLVKVIIINRLNILNAYTVKNQFEVDLSNKIKISKEEQTYE